MAEHDLGGPAQATMDQVEAVGGIISLFNGIKSGLEESGWSSGGAEQAAMLAYTGMIQTNIAETEARSRGAGRA